MLPVTQVTGTRVRLCLEFIFIASAPHINVGSSQETFLPCNRILIYIASSCETKSLDNTPTPPHDTYTGNFSAKTLRTPTDCRRLTMWKFRGGRTVVVKREGSIETRLLVCVFPIMVVQSRSRKCSNWGPFRGRID